ncbi:dehydrogenase [Amycolatopsis acidicola]|uniref:Dehydrogenase n=1 Tax=Amycolatopsis acidicola TaxID=2596893 RepID=A0A5N0VIK9_9PSEU|nr:acyl-CoA dehydrogenase family protein [Amycolatopsis acidicola]KAA9166025.1 dehydrogenase [Amycolatopsis acidicola]
MTAESVSEFRNRAHTWLSEHLVQWTAADDGADDGSDQEAVARVKEFQAALHDAGFAGISWPAEYGGQGLTVEYERAFADELAAFDPPARLLLVGLGMCGPTLLTLGTEKQKRRYVRPLVRGEEVWCQLFSEPGAGSDLAGLRSSARQDGDAWVITGQKVWTSHAKACDFGLALVRTDAGEPKHKGLTMFVVDMSQPGVTVRPLRQMTGSAEFNEVFLDDVRVPGTQVVGGIGGGWNAAIVMLMNERTSIGASSRKLSRVSAHDLAQLARKHGRDDDTEIRRTIADLYLRERALAGLGAGIQAKVRAGTDPGPAGSIAKVVKARLTKSAAELAFRIAGAEATAWLEASGEGLAEALSRSRAASLAGGTDDIQRTIIGERLIGLPREPAVDRGIPFRDLGKAGAGESW